MANLPDEQLVKSAQNGDRESMCELLARYERKTYNLAFRLMGNHADASDAAQEALVRIYVRLPNFRGDSAFSTWLFRVATNACLDELRRRGRLRHSSLDEAATLDLPYPPAEFGSECDSPVEKAEQREVQAAVQRAITRLPDDYRAVVVLRDIKNYSYQEIAAVLGTTVGTVKSRLHRARLALRNVIRATEASRLDLGRIAG
jgi:RNA polymerase sigma-70 factor (ECF subfamily)